MSPSPGRPCVTEGVPGTNVTFAAGNEWDHLVILSPQAPGTVMAKVREAGAISAAQVRPPVPQDYVLVHQAYSPATAIQGVRPYVHAVSAPAIDR